MTDEANVGAPFGLERDNFILDPASDHSCFARSDINTQEIAASLEVDVITGLTPKRILWGPYGGGKTHTLMRTVVELEKLAKIHYVRIECPDFAKKSRFHDLYREGIMRNLGQDFVLGLMQEVTRKVGMKQKDELRAVLKKWFLDEEIAKAAEHLYDPNFDHLKIWRWLSGVPVSRKDLDSLRQTQDLNQAEAARLADIVAMIGTLLKKLHDTTLVLILDEMERLSSIGPDTVGTFVSGFTRLMDPSQRSVCILVGSSAASQDELLDVFAEEGPVGTRLGKTAYVPINNLNPDDVDQFIETVIKHVRTPNADIDALISSADAAGETLDKDSFPFTKEAIDAIKNETKTVTPRDVTLLMTRALGQAHRNKSTAITSQCVK